MYLAQIIQYLIWPALIIAAWVAIRVALNYYEKKFPGQKDTAD
jgi:hypothetical protein